MTDEFFGRLALRYNRALEDALRAAVPEATGPLAEFYGMMRYHMGWVDSGFREAVRSPGKRIRPFCCLAACERAGGDYHAALSAAVAVEMLHNFSLIHDDIEDQSQQRRHRPTVWSVWGIPQAINVGDGVFTLAFRMLLEMTAEPLDAGIALAVRRAFQHASLALCEGQHLDIAMQETASLRGVDVAQYQQMVANKTGALLGASVEIGALLAGVDTVKAAAYRQFGEHLGLAFQMQDDVMGIWGRETETGKLADDLQQGKKTYPVVWTAWRAEESVRDTLVGLYVRGPLEAKSANSIRKILEANGAREHALAEAGRIYGLGVQCLAEAGASACAPDPLLLVADSLLARED